MYTYHAPSNTVREKPKIPNPIDMTYFLAYVGVYGEVVIDAAIAALIGEYSDIGLQESKKQTA
jgi:hypothetical protein